MVPEISIASDSVISTEIETLFPFSSVAVTEYVPAVKPSRSSVVSPFDHRYVITPAPPLTVTSIEPSAAPLHETPYPLKSEWVSEINNSSGEVNVTSIETEQHFRQ